MYRFTLFLWTIILFSGQTFCQEIELFQQFNGRYDYTAIGNTLNQFENNIDRDFCELLPESSAELALDPNTSIVAAYLYWAGSGSGDTQVKLNEEFIAADNTYTVDYNDPNFGLLTYFASYTDVTQYIQTTGNGTYVFSDLDISEPLATFPGYCQNRTNFGGWAIYIIFEDADLPLNQINLFQGLEIINRNVQEKIIVLENINVLDNDGAKIGFLAWEGDALLNFGESLSINNNIISNPPLNPANNAFNGTNSFTGSNEFYNCDLDFYNIENNISIGDTSAEIKLTTGQLIGGTIFADLIIINNIITVLNSQLPDATIEISQAKPICATRNIEIDYTVYNRNATDLLPANTPIAFYAGTELIGQSQTLADIQIGGSESNSLILNIPDAIPDNFVLNVMVDDDGTGTGIVLELNENNNTTSSLIELIPIPEIQSLDPLLGCDVGFNTAFFDLTVRENDIIIQSPDDIQYFNSLEDLQTNVNAILIPSSYQNNTLPQFIYIRVETDLCYEIYRFELLVENCPPYVPQVFTPNNDGYNDWFNIQGLYDIFERHQLLIYNRWGTLIFEGNNDLKWYGRANKGISNQGQLMPVGTYYYVLYLNDSNYKPLTGFVYMTY